MSKNTIDSVKKTVQRHRVIPFNVRDIACGDKRVFIKGHKVVQDTQLLDLLGIKNTLSRKVIDSHENKWTDLQDALSTIDKNKRLGAIVDNNNQVVSVLKKAPREEENLDFSNRIDALMNAFEDTDRSFHDITFNSHNATVSINSNVDEIIECGIGDDWNFGTTISIGYDTQSFTDFYLRLLCTNGMTTRERLATRVLGKSSNIDKQFISYTKGKTASKSITDRVNALRNTRASFHEVKAVADCLSKNGVDELMPFYERIINDYGKRGVAVLDKTVKQQRFVATDQNAYDIFNIATYAATHRRKNIGSRKSLNLNKAASDMFTKGPDLSTRTIDIYAGKN